MLQTAEKTDTPLPPPRNSLGMKPAMIVGGLAVVIVVGFIVMGLVTTPKAVSVNTGTGATKVSGSTLLAQPAAHGLAPILTPGQPPANILNAVTLPDGATRLSHQTNSSAADQYDAQVTFATSDSANAVIQFYKSEMKRLGWGIFSTGTPIHHANQYEVLGKKAGSDSFYWEMGATVSPTKFGGDNGPKGTTDFTVRLFQVPDED